MLTNERFAAALFTSLVSAILLLTLYALSFAMSVSSALPKGAFTATPSSTPAFTSTITPTNIAVVTSTLTGTPNNTSTNTPVATATLGTPVATGTPSPSPSPTQCTSSWVIVPSPNGGAYPILYGVAVVGDNDIWAVGLVGNLQSPTQTLIEHWDGSAWSVVPSPNPGTFSNQLMRVAVVTVDDVWAVGYFGNASNVEQTLIEHWDGSIWTVVPSPNPGTGTNHLYAIAVVSANDIWAVGAAGYRPDPSYALLWTTLVEHWDGSAWSVVASPNMGTEDNVLYGIAVVGQHDIWAVGLHDTNGAEQPLVEH